MIRAAPGRHETMGSSTEGIHGGGVPDLISSLPDHLLHCILVRLPDTAAAARTSVLSRRWRRVWAHLPELSFRHPYGSGGSRWRGSEDLKPRRVDAALAAFAAPVVTLLDVALPWLSRAPAAASECKQHDGAALMPFASQRVAGELRLSLHDGWGDVVIPTYGRATAIALTVPRHRLRLPAGGAGAFTALAVLRIKRARVERRELEHALSARCPSLKELVLKEVALASRDDPALCVRSDSLERLEVDVSRSFDARLWVIASKLKVLSLKIFCKAHIDAPKLSEVCWHGFDATQHKIVEAGRHLRRLEIATGSPEVRLMRQFNAVHELQLTVKISKGTEERDIYLEHINKLSECEVLVVRFVKIQHAIRPVILHLLKKCAGVKKIVVGLLVYRKDDCKCRSWECQCGWPKQNHTTGNIALGSLELVEISENMDAYHKVEFVKLLCEYSATFKKKVTITIIENKNREYVREKIGNICVPYNKVVINVRSTRAGPSTDSCKNK